MRQHHGMVCPPAADVAGSRPCASPPGASPTFFLEFVGFDVGAGYRGVDGKPIGHLIVAATPHRDGWPCFGNVIGTIRLPGVTATELRCSSDSLRAQRGAQNGEGAYVGHVMLTWTQHGVDYSVSAHRYSAVNLAVVERVVGSLAFIAPSAGSPAP